MAELGRSCRSVRHYDGTPIDDAIVDRWLETARWTGSSRNSQPWRFVVVRDLVAKAQLAILGESAAHLAQAPVVVVIAAEEGPFPFSTVFDLGRVSQSLVLSAAADGVGSCIAVFEPAAKIQRARRLLGIPERMRVDLAIAFGRPGTATPGEADSGVNVPRGRRPLSELASSERFGTSIIDAGR